MKGSLSSAKTLSFKTVFRAWNRGFDSVDLNGYLEQIHLEIKYILKIKKWKAHV